MQLKRIESHQQYFNGKVMFVSHNGHNLTEHLELYFPKELRSELTEIRGLIKKKPYDLFISKDSRFSGYYRFDANKKYSNIVRKTNNHPPVFVHADIIKSSIVEAVQNALSIYEKILK